MRIWRIKDAAPKHIPAIAAAMREVDRREVWASHGHTPEEALRTSLAASVLAWTCFVRGVPAFMWGVAVDAEHCATGRPWLLGTDAINAVGRQFLKQSRAYIETMQEPFERLENIVHADNTLSLRWLRWCGFIIGRETVERGGERFFPFWKEAACRTR